MNRDETTFRNVAAQFPVLQRELPNGRRLTYLDSAASAQKPQCVIDRLHEVYSGTYANVHRGVHQLGDRITEWHEAARHTVAAFLGASSPEHVVFTSGTTMSINLVAQGWAEHQLQSGDEIVVNLSEHHANLVPWQVVAKRTGAVLRYVDLLPDGRLDPDDLKAAIGDRTRLVAVSGMSNTLGTVHPIEEIIELAHAARAVVVIDAAQSAAHRPLRVSELGADFVACSGHKLYGPTGIGVLYGRPDRLREMEPLLFGGHMIEEVTCESSSWADPPAKFEGGTPPIVEAIGLATAIDFIQSIGLEKISAWEHALLTRAQRELEKIPGVTIHGPAVEHKGAILTFTVERIHPHDLSQLLDECGVAVRAGHHCTMPLHRWLKQPATTRASFGVYNTDEDVDTLVEAIHHARRRFRLA